MKKTFIVTILSLALGIMPSLVGAGPHTETLPTKNQAVAAQGYQKVGYQTVRYRDGHGHYGHRYYGGHHRYYGGYYGHHRYYRYYTPYRHWVKKCYIRNHKTYCYRVKVW